MWSRVGLVSLFSLPLPLACSAGAQQLSAHINLLLSHESPATDFPSLSYALTHTDVQWVLKLQNENISMDFPPLMQQENKSNVFFWLAGDHQHCTLSRWSHCTMQLCWGSHLHTDAHFANFLPHVCLNLSCSSDFDLDYDSYHEDYYDRYCQKAAHAGSHTLLLVCVTQETKCGFFILAVPGSLCSLSLSANNCLSSFHSTARSSHPGSLTDIDTVFLYIDLHTYSTDTQTVKPIKIFSISSVLHICFKVASIQSQFSLILSECI